MVVRPLCGVTLLDICFRKQVPVIPVCADSCQCSTQHQLEPRFQGPSEVSSVDGTHCAHTLRTSCPRNALKKQTCVSPASQDEHGEEDHGAASAGGVQSAGQRLGPDAPPPALHRAMPPSEAHDPEGAGGKAVHDAASVQQGFWKCSTKYNDRKIF